jgi:hypothetical protein
MDRAQLLAELADAGNAAGGIVFVERRGDDYQWSHLPPDEVPSLVTDARSPDAWIVYSGPWPTESAPSFLEDLLAEMESMCGGAYRCRWPLDQPYPPGH